MELEKWVVSLVRFGCELNEPEHGWWVGGVATSRLRVTWRESSRHASGPPWARSEAMSTWQGLGVT